ncbi:MAG: hypothetical protein CMJ50_00130 [Planctomycetaceae bacterium]|jgi:hypothetical protein|nr:hypothetical protein [Planctomycetaceae bacterium]
MTLSGVISMIRHLQFRLVLAAFVLGSVYCVAQDPELVPSQTPKIAELGDNNPTLTVPQPSASGRPLTPDRYQPTPVLATPVSPSAEIPKNENVSAAAPSQFVEFQYTVTRPVTAKVQMPHGKIAEVVKYVSETQSIRVNIADDLQHLELPPEGKRVAVLAVTAARHQGLLEKLKAAETPEEEEAASLALKENYTEHYAIETWWREQKLSELETRLQELRSQVTQRQESEEKYVSAAMTIAGLWADGIGITPPTPNRQPVGTPTSLPLPGPIPTDFPSTNSFTPRPNLPLGPDSSPFAPGPSPRATN